MTLMESTRCKKEWRTEINKKRKDTYIEWINKCKIGSLGSLTKLTNLMGNWSKEREGNNKQYLE